MFIAALLKTAKVWKQPKCLSTDELIKKVCCTYITEMLGIRKKYYEGKKAKWLSEEALEIAEKRRDVKDQGEKERYIHLECRVPKIINER